MASSPAASVIETGCARFPLFSGVQGIICTYGVSSAYLLLALQRNGKGTLHSTELGDTTFLSAGCSSGWIVPEWLCERWAFYWSDSRQLLALLLNDPGMIDLFIHDSLHSYEHMTFEYEQAYPRLCPGGILISGDALWNRAFADFAGKAHPAASKILRGIGVMKKQ